MKHCLLVIGMFAGGSTVAFAADQTGINEETKIIFSQVVSKCPGVEKFQDDFQSVTSRTNGDIFYDGAYQTGLKELKVQIKDKTSIIPASFNAHGHTCTYTFTKEEDRVITMKNACVSICEGTFTEDNGANYEKR